MNRGEINGRKPTRTESIRDSRSSQQGNFWARVGIKGCESETADSGADDDTSEEDLERVEVEPVDVGSEGEEVAEDWAEGCSCYAIWEVCWCA